MTSKESERIRIHDVVLKTGLAKRTIQKMAQRGEIPGAAKLGTVWTFNRQKLGRWIADAERRCGSSEVHRQELWSSVANPFVEQIRERGKYGRATRGRPK